jgi:hypothetical protein
MKSFRKFSKMIFAASVFTLLAPSPLFACAACYGRSDSPLANGMNWGIFTLLGVVVSVLSCFGGFLIFIVRRQNAYAKLMEEQALQQKLSEVKI